MGSGSVLGFLVFLLGNIHRLGTTLDYQTDHWLGRSDFRTGGISAAHACENMSTNIISPNQKINLIGGNFVDGHVLR